MQYSLETLQVMMEINNGDLDLIGTEITSLPQGLIVEGDLDVSNTPLTSLPENLHVKGSLYATHTKISTLPKGLLIGKSLQMSDTSLTSLPNDLQLKGSIYIANTKITTLPNNFSVNGNLDLENTYLTTLPQGLTVKGYLDVSNTPITSLPEGLVVGSALYLKNTFITALPKGIKAFYIDSNENQLSNPNDYTTWQEGDYKENEYVYADGILTFIKRTRQVGTYTFHQGRFPNQHVITDGTFYAHCHSLKAGIRDLAFKHAKNLSVEAYEHLTISDTISVDEAITMYRVLTGACQAGVDSFVSSLGKLKETYTVQEIISLTKGNYGHETFQDSFLKTA